MFGKHVRILAIAAATAGVVAATVAQAADPRLERAAAELRVGELKSVRYAGDGLGWTFGQAYRPNDAWPKIRLNAWTRTPQGWKFAAWQSCPQPQA